MAFAPDQEECPSPLQEVALLEVQERAREVLYGIVIGPSEPLPLRSTLGSGTDVTVTLSEAEAWLVLQVNPNRTVPLNGPIFWEPLAGLAPDQRAGTSGDAAQESLLLEVQEIPR